MTTTTRRYDSSRRRETAAETRATIVAASTRLFSTQGWAGTGMKDVAREAGVSVETIYASVGNKAALLKEALDVAVVGDADPVGLSVRPEFVALGTGTASVRAAAMGRMLGGMYGRTAPLHRALDHAAAGDPDLGALEESVRATVRRSFAEGGRLLTGRDLTPTETDGLMACLGNQVYLLLTEGSGWSDEQYAAWAADTAIRLLGLREEER